MSEATPIVERDGRWFLTVPPKCELLCGSHFDPEHGYCVVIAFANSSQANFLTPGYARAVAEQIRKDEDQQGILAFADSVDALAAEMAFYGAVWEAAGRPADGIDTNIVGKA